MPRASAVCCELRPLPDYTVWLPVPALHWFPVIYWVVVQTEVGGQNTSPGHSLMDNVVMEENVVNPLSAQSRERKRVPYEGNMEGDGTAKTQMFRVTRVFSPIHSPV